MRALPFLTPAKGELWPLGEHLKVLVLRVGSVLAQERNTGACQSTAPSRILCFVALWMLRVPSRIPVVPGDLGCSGFGKQGVVRRLSFGLPKYQTRGFPISFCREIVYFRLC